MLAMNNAEAQTNANELAVINQLSTQSAVVNMPVSKLLNAPGNEALKAFFFTPVKNKSALKGKKIAVLVADGFETSNRLMVPVHDDQRKHRPERYKGRLTDLQVPSRQHRRA